MADLSKLLTTTQVTDVESRVASVDDVLSSKTETSTKKVYSFHDVSQVSKPLSSLPIKERNTKEISAMSDDSLTSLSNKVNFEVKTDEDLEKAFTEMSENLSLLDKQIDFDSSFTSNDMMEKIPSLDEKDTISNKVMTKGGMDKQEIVRNDNKFLANQLYSSSITTASDYTTNFTEDFTIDVNKLNTDNVEILDNIHKQLDFYNSDDVSMSHLQNLSMSSVKLLQDSYKTVLSNMESLCDGLEGIYNGVFTSINDLFAGINNLLNISLGFNNSSLLGDLLDCFSFASEAMTDVDNITKVGAGISQNGSIDIVDKFLEHADKSKLSFPALITDTFKNGKGKARERNLVYDKKQAQYKYDAIKADYEINDDVVLKRNMRTTKIHNESILDQEEIYDIHKIQQDNDLSEMIMTQDDDSDNYHNLLKNQPLTHFV